MEEIALDLLQERLWTRDDEARRVPGYFRQLSRQVTSRLARRGSVLRAVEMLRSDTWGLQPFKFVRLYDDECRLQAAIQSFLDQNRDHRQIERYRYG